MPPVETPGDGPEECLGDGPRGSLRGGPGRCPGGGAPGLKCFTENGTELNLELRRIMMD